MAFTRWLSDLRELRTAVREALADQAADEETASFELAASARGFSRRTKAVVDDKLSFSAVLMRAGEVDAANRLLAEVERDVETEEAALIEKVNEVHAARAMHRERITRLRLVKTLAVAVLGSSLLGLSAMGVAVAGMFKDRTNVIAGATGPSLGQAGSATAREAHRKNGKTVRIAGIRVALSSRQLAEYRQILGDGAHPDALVQFLSNLDLPSAVMNQALAAVSTVRATASTALEPVVATVEEQKKKTSKTPEESKPSPQQQQAEDDSSPEPDDGSGGGDGEEEEEEGDSNLPPLPFE